MTQNPENGIQSKVVNLQTRMSMVIRVQVQGTGEGRFRESQGWSTNGLGRSRSLRQAWVDIKQINTNINGKGTGRLVTNKQANKTRLWQVDKTRQDYNKKFMTHRKSLERLWEDTSTI